MTQTNTHSTSTTDFDQYISVRGEVVNVLGPLYENPMFRKIRWRTSIGKQRDFSLLGNLLRRKFSSNGSDPLIVMGDKAAQTAARFHAPTQGVGLRYQLSSTRVSHPLVGRVPYVFIMSRLSRKYDNNQYQTCQPPSLATSITCGNRHTSTVAVSKYAVQVGV
jgi:hypothetical protein